jgi:hypothetical protein
VVAAASLLLTLLPFCTGTVGTFTKDGGISGGITGANTSPGSRDWYTGARGLLWRFVVMLCLMVSAWAPSMSYVHTGTFKHHKVR